MDNSTNRTLRPVVIFLALTFSLSAIFYFFIIYSGMTGGGRRLYVTGLMWCPGISALITMKILNRNISELGWKWGATKYQFWSYLIPITYSLIAYVIVWASGLGAFYNEKFVDGLVGDFGLGEIPDGLIIALYVLLMAVFGTIRSTISALGEEIGWRGFFVPELYIRFSFAKTAIVSGLIWSIWHIPILLFADYNSGTPSWYALSCFFVLVVSMSFIYTWFRIMSGSLWTGVILHATHNLFIQAIFTPLTKDTGKTAYYIDEFGIVLPVVTVAFAIYYWSRRDELKPVVTTGQAG